MKEKYQLEYLLKSVSITLLWNAISTDSGLQEWFADKVSISGKRFTFRWADYEQTAELIAMRTNMQLRLKWEEDIHEKYYFEFRIVTDELTGDVALLLTDFASVEDMADAKNLWNRQIRDMFRKNGIEPEN